MNKLIVNIVKFFKRIFFTAKVINIITDTKKQETVTIEEPAAEIKEISWFTRKNNLAEEFYYIPTPVYGMNLDDTTPIGFLQADGSITADSITVEQWDRGGRRIELESKELLGDDVDLIKDKDIIVYPESTTAKI